MNSKVKIFYNLLILFTISGVSLVCSGADMDEALKAMGRLFKQTNDISNNQNVSAHLAKQQEFKKKFANNTDTYDLIKQGVATYYATVGLYNEAFEEFKAYSNNKLSKEVLEQYSLLNAVEEIEKLAKLNSIVMISEAHHLPKHRWLTFKLLKKLKLQGYKYLAVEALRKKCEQSVNELGYVHTSCGGYLQEAMFGGMLLEAKSLGFKLVAYDSTGKDREKNAAKNIVESIYRGDPHAKVIVHVGYDHINKKNKLASILIQMLDISLLSVDQHTFGASNLIDDNNHLPKVFFLSEKGYWSAKPNQYDLTVHWPEDKSVKGRPIWFMEGYQSVPVDPKWCFNSFPCLIIVNDTNKPDSVPIDRLLLTSEDGQKSLRYKSINNAISVHDGSGNLINSFILKNIQFSDLEM